MTQMRLGRLSSIFTMWLRPMNWGLSSVNTKMAALENFETVWFLAQSWAVGAIRFQAKRIEIDWFPTTGVFGADVQGNFTGLFDFHRTDVDHGKPVPTLRLRSFRRNILAANTNDKLPVAIRGRNHRGDFINARLA